MKRVISFIAVLSVMLTALVFPVQAAEVPAFKAESVSGNPGDLVEVKIDIVNNPGIAALQINVAYSSEDLELDSINDGGVFKDAVTHSPLGENPVYISWYSSDSSNSSQNGTLAVLKFRIKENAQTSELSVSYDKENVFDNSLKNVSFDTQNGRVNISSGESDILIGDVNADGKINITDATMIQKAVAELIELTDEQKKAADTNADGKVDITDATMIQKYVAELIDHLGKK